MPLILEKTVSKGHCLIFAFPADNGWGDWAIHRLYLPIVHQLLGYLTGRLPETNPVKYDRAGTKAAQAPGVTMVDGKAIVRNIDVTESDIERTTASGLREHYRLPEVSEGDALVDEASEIGAGGGERPDEFWRTVAWALLIVLLLETFVANRTYA